ncbi:hypothetical protein EAI30_00505 [Romboutsia ilealis]|uniref:DUF4097 family beta strand repeat protein n=1 Tax=Romboutsia faecis TaxID=2764597 RepID=A0ABR7JM92_9FIRM|nr:DUF4097 family beta strand repeat-containing protein [Romboutsia faecis]MBC5995887.1 DUF4097 family beta strand repeat protein [Romboutsia faecis]MRN23086.1 hypothetical protein [Romboutsia ilealis]
MRKRYNIFRIVFWSTVSLCLTFVLTYLSKSEKEIFNFIGFNYVRSDESLNITAEKTIDLNNINDINFNLDVDDITFMDSSDEKIKIVEKCNKELSENERLQIKHQNNKIDIYRNSKLNINRLDKSFRRELIVYLPKSYNKNINVKLSVGDLDFTSDLNLNTLKIYLTTGDIDIDNNIKCKSFILEGNTGDASINSLSSNEYGISFNTGNIEISSLSGKGYINTTTGDLRCNIFDITGNSDFSSSVGDITLNLKKEPNFKINASCDIGDIKTDFKENSIRESFSNELNIDCGCGDIKINKNY